jgi:hypothetical protein
MDVSAFSPCYSMCAMQDKRLPFLFCTMLAVITAATSCLSPYFRLFYSMYEILFLFSSCLGQA